MKDYQNVVEARFDNEKEGELSIYSPNHPIGKYSRKYLFKGIDTFLEWYLKERDSVSDKMIADFGCGSGEMLKLLIDKGFPAEKATGVDLSSLRINKAIKTYPDLNFICGDALKIELEQSQFDLITSFDLFSHIKSEEEIVNGLINLKNHLIDEGLFFWYDIYSKDHFNSPSNIDSWGFSKDQMIELAAKSGFELVYYKPFFKLFFNRFHSIYQVKRFSPIIVLFLEKLIPGSPGNMLLVFKKKTI